MQGTFTTYERHRYLRSQAALLSSVSHPIDSSLERHQHKVPSLPPSPHRTQYNEAWYLLSSTLQQYSSTTSNSAPQSKSGQGCCDSTERTVNVQRTQCQGVALALLALSTRHGTAHCLTFCSCA